MKAENKITRTDRLREGFARVYNVLDVYSDGEIAGIFTYPTIAMAEQAVINASKVGLTSTIYLGSVFIAGEDDYNRLEKF